MRSDQIAQGFSWLNLENLQGWRQHNLFGQLVPMLDCPNVEFFSPYTQSETLLVFQFMSTVFCPPAGHHCEKPESVLLTATSQTLEDCY